MRIGEVAERAGVSTRALRYYEEQGLLEPERTASGQRIYTESSVARVQLIQQLFTAGLNSQLLATLLPAIDARHIGPGLSERLLAEHTRIESEIAGLQAAGRRLAALIGLVTHPDDMPCPASLDEAVAGDLPVFERTPVRPSRRVRVV
ncbi:DNA-binding transcriptional MerR regulator [Streptomyces sp. V3I8]|uniref:MerR family transcriptional regulator n=1 Tax=Streptomyces sp. V3I8 TaxID=3042279 RepID=UPI00277D8277|nr:MerR family transcriptional regulator [Streptomyces sp. V3I8]MDQ1041248.1 DNA-binding transcriptional MerR regulator [Streptomyces sp. V3I8]